MVTRGKMGALILPHLMKVTDQRNELRDGVKVQGECWYCIIQFCITARLQFYCVSRGRNSMRSPENFSILFSKH